MDKQFLTAFGEIIREQVTQNHDVQIEDVGTFHLNHRTQYQQQYDDGRVAMMPPKDSLMFIPEK